MSASPETAHDRPMLIAEDLLLLLTADDTGKAAADSSNTKIALGGALLAELALMERVDIADPDERVTEGRLILRDASQTGDSLLDDALATVGLGILLPVSFLSDIFYPAAEGPAWMSTVGSVLPLKHIANSLSAALDPGPPGVSATSVAVLAAWLVGAGLVAWRGFSWSVSGHRPPERADERRRPVAAGSGPSA